MSKIQYEIITPFAQNGDRNAIPETSSDALVNKSQGFTNRYSTPPVDGGAYITREDFNGLVFETQQAIKELQELLITTISNIKPDSNGNIDITANLVSGLGKLATKDKANLTSDVDGILPESSGGTGNTSLDQAVTNLINISIAGLMIEHSSSLYTLRIGLDADGAILNTNGNINLYTGADGIVTIDNKNIRDYVIPVGFIYIQLRNQSTPDELFGTSGKWQDISATYAGEFFRAVGGNSGSFGNTQAEGLPNITGTYKSINAMSEVNASGCFNILKGFAGINGIADGGSYVGGWGIIEAVLLASRSSYAYGSSTHVTPYNSAVRIWKKIA